MCGMRASSGSQEAVPQKWLVTAFPAAQGCVRYTASNQLGTVPNKRAYSHLQTISYHFCWLLENLVLSKHREKEEDT